MKESLVAKIVRLEMTIEDLQEQVQQAQAERDQANATIAAMRRRQAEAAAELSDVGRLV